MDLDNLKTFLEVHKTRHFGRAADNLFLTSAAVSARIKQLEQYLGVSLFVRNRGNVQLTSEGERLLPHAQNLILNWSRTLQEIALQKSQTSRLHLGSTTSLWQSNLAEKLQNINRHHPHLSLQAEAHPDYELARHLMERTLDLIILYEPPDLPELSAEKIGHLRLSMASTEPQQLAKTAFQKGYIFVDWGESFTVFHASRFGEVPPANMTVNLASLAVELLKVRPGSAFLSQRLLDTTDFLFPVKGVVSFNRPIYAVYREGHEQLETIKKVIQCLQGFSM